ncbi:hypothetical protein ACRAWF_47390 [Streptomyces sp. L7]
MTLVVTGASPGRTGRRVAEAARAAGLTVRAASRAQGFDWADAVHVGGHPAGCRCRVPGVPLGRRERRTRPARWGCWRAEAVGSRRTAAGAAVVPGRERARPTEEALRGSGADWTVVRAAWFAQNFSEGPLVEGAAGERGAGVSGR